MKKTIRWVMCVALLIATLGAFCTTASASENPALGIGIVDSTGLRLRQYAGTDSEVLASAQEGDVVVVLDEYGDWYEVIYNLELGYMHKDYVIFKAVENADLGEAVVNCSTVNLRAKPSSSAEKLAELDGGETVNIIGLNNGWYKVDYITVYGWTTGYIRSDLLDLTEIPPENSNVTYQESIGVQICNYAKNYLGVPYVWGGTTTSGFDCSGYTQYVFRQFGYEIYRVAESQMRNGYAVDQANLLPGDLVFFNRTYASNEAATHVGIYIGGGEFIHAASGGVKITDLSADYYASRYVGARRIVG